MARHIRLCLLGTRQLCQHRVRVWLLLLLLLNVIVFVILFSRVSENSSRLEKGGVRMLPDLSAVSNLSAVSSLSAVSNSSSVASAKPRIGSNGSVLSGAARAESGELTKQAVSVGL
ncbi:hypothetical protein BaRGS_00024283 [Batillaria attramentaria]|uniref:Uncharacterized protein n=1 Tax=Batillaria attramentaria TaxID=370345 RepID=A0ABD0KBU3_9CAEN